MSNSSVPAAPAPSSRGSPPGDASRVAILLMGHTGAGRSHFINRAAGEDIAPVNHSLSTTDFNIHSYPIGNPDVGDPGDPRSQITLVETPGLDNGDERYSDVEIIKRIGSWLEHCDNDVVVGGIIVLHDITQDDVTSYAGAQAWPVKYFDSPAVLQRLVLTTGKWDLGFVARNKRKYVKREHELRGIHAWKRLLSRGAILGPRYEGDHESAWNVINSLPEKDPLTVQEIRKAFSTIEDRLLAKAPPRPLSGLVQLVRSLFERTSNFSIPTATARKTADKKKGKRKADENAENGGNIHVFSGAQGGHVGNLVVASGKDMHYHHHHADLDSYHRHYHHHHHYYQRQRPRHNLRPQGSHRDHDSRSKHLHHHGLNPIDGTNVAITRSVQGQSTCR